MDFAFARGQRWGKVLETEICRTSFARGGVMFGETLNFIEYVKHKLYVRI